MAQMIAGHVLIQQTPPRCGRKRSHLEFSFLFVMWIAFDFLRDCGRKSLSDSHRHLGTLLCGPWRPLVPSSHILMWQVCRVASAAVVVYHRCSIVSRICSIFTQQASGHCPIGWMTLRSMADIGH